MVALVDSVEVASFAYIFLIWLLYILLLGGNLLSHPSLPHQAVDNRCFMITSLGTYMDLLIFLG